MNRRKSSKTKRQQEWQLRQKALGRCTICGEPLATEWHCIRHAVAARDRQRKMKKCRRRYHSLTYRIKELALAAGTAGGGKQKP